VKCDQRNATTDLINPKSIITGETPIMKSTKHWFYRWIVTNFLKEWILVGHKVTGNERLWSSKIMDRWRTRTSRSNT
jgi:methionyl-tRNA synthetase